MGKKKKFFDKKKSAKFQLLARDSSDPNYDGTPGSDRVFVRVDNSSYCADVLFPDDNPHLSGTFGGEDDPNSIFADAPEDYDDGEDDDRVSGNLARSVEHSLPEHVRKEIVELGFPDDGYNYLAHLREIKNTGGGSAFYHNPKAKLDQLPHDVKAYDASRLHISEVDGDPDAKSVYSVASKALGVRVQKVVDAEVAALLDDDSDASRFASDVEDLEEDFVVQANLSDAEEGVCINQTLNLNEQSKSKYAIDDEADTFDQADNILIDGVSTVEKPQNDSVLEKPQNDSVLEKPRVRRLLDEQFDLLERQEYGTDDEDDDYGYVADEDEFLAEKLKHTLNNRAMDDYELGGEYKAPADLIHGSEKTTNAELLDSASHVIRRCMEYAKKYENEDQDEDVVFAEESSEESEVWDCETIVSTYSNLDNHPGRIDAPQATRKKKLAETVSGALNASNHVITLKGKEKLPVDFLPRGKKTVEKVKSGSTFRPEQQKRTQQNQESREEKKERKAAVKTERRQARRVKKETKELYMGEAQHAQRIAAISGPSSIRLA